MVIPPPPPVNLKLHSITKSFQGRTVLDHVTAGFESFRTLVLIGPSGGGKSTLLRIIAGLEIPDSGHVELEGRPIGNTETALWEHRRQVGVVFQAFNLFPHLSALANITLPLEKVHGMSAQIAAQTANQCLERFKLGAHAYKKPAELSGGQKQRLAIARAIAIKPRLLLLDEPTSALDPEMTAEVLDLIEELKNEGLKFLLVTHQMGFAKRVADDAAFLAGGKILEYGPARNLFEAPQSGECRDFLSKVLSY